MLKVQIIQAIDWIVYIASFVIGIYCIIASNVIQNYANRTTDTYKSEIDADHVEIPQFYFCDPSNRISELNGSSFQIEYHITEDDGWKWSKLKEIQIKKIENCLYIAPSKLNFSYKIEHSIRIRFRDVFTYLILLIL